MYSRATMLALAEVLGTEARIAHATSVAMARCAFHGEADAYKYTAQRLAERAAHFAAGALGPEDDYQGRCPSCGDPRCEAAPYCAMLKGDRL